jgi:cytochrome c-type biogenesis protein CcmH
MMRIVPLAFMAFMMFVQPLAGQDLLPPAPYAYKQLADPAQEAKAQALMETLRCLKCQSQAISDSDAPMAGDMRHQVRTRIAAGEDPEKIEADMGDVLGNMMGGEGGPGGGGGGAYSKDPGLYDY